MYRMYTTHARIMYIYGSVIEVAFEYTHKNIYITQDIVMSERKKISHFISLMTECSTGALDVKMCARNHNSNNQLGL